MKHAYTSIEYLTLTFSEQGTGAKMRFIVGPNYRRKKEEA
jgi:hypothetical protein